MSAEWINAMITIMHDYYTNIVRSVIFLLYANLLLISITNTTVTNTMKSRTPPTVPPAITSTIFTELSLFSIIIEKKINSSIQSNHDLILKLKHIRCVCVHRLTYNNAIILITCNHFQSLYYKDAQ